MYEKVNYLTTVKPETKDKAEKELSKEEHLPAQGTLVSSLTVEVMIIIP